MTSHPKDASHKSVPDTIAAQPKLCKHLHLPVQCGSTTRAPAQMNRRLYGGTVYGARSSTPRSRVPGMTFSSDIIVGFPGETEEDFQGTLDLVTRGGLYAAVHLHLLQAYRHQSSR